MDDEDAFLYGDEDPYAASAAPTASAEDATNVETSADQAVTATDQVPSTEDADDDGGEPMVQSDEDMPEGGDEEEEEAEESEDDVEIIIEPVPRSIDFRDPSHQRTTVVRPPVISQPPSSSLMTTEYTPRERESALAPQRQSQTPVPSSSVPPPSADAATSEEKPPLPPIPDGPPPRASSNAPDIDPSATGMLDARSIYDIEMQSLSEKNWRRPGSDLSDWFNYGFDEISWEAYCLRRKELGEMSVALKQNVMSFAGLPEQQFLALPPEIRTMAINQANMMNAMPMGVNPNMMAHMGGMQADMMGMGGMGMQGMGGMPPNMMGPGMNGDHGPQGHMNGPMMGNMQNMQQSMPDGDMGGQEGFQNPYAQGMQGMPIPGPQGGMPEGVGQDQAPFNGYQPGFNGDANVQPIEPSFAGRGGPVRGMRGGRGTPPARGAIPVRGRGRGMGYVGTDNNMQALPPRPASPLPPNVPTGPRNRTTYKDKDREPVKQDVEGLDYGGGSGYESTPGSRKRPFSGEEDNGRSKRR